MSKSKKIRKRESKKLKARVGASSTTKPISLRVEIDVLNWFKSRGPGYQTRMNDVLRRCMRSAGKK